MMVRLPLDTHERNEDLRTESLVVRSLLMSTQHDHDAQLNRRAFLHAAGLALTPTFPTTWRPGAREELSSIRTTLSREGCGRATGYAEATKILAHGPHTFVAWLDVTSMGFQVRVRHHHAEQQRWSETITLGTAHDNHGGPAIALDGRGHLHVAYGPHHHPLRYRRTREPFDVRTWTDEERIGERCTYPTLVADREGQLWLSARVSHRDRPWEVHLWRRTDDGAWGAPRPILRAREGGYAHFQEALALDGRGRLHVSARFHGGRDAHGYAVATMLSEDGGETFARYDGEAIELPARADAMTTLRVKDRKGTSVGLRCGTLAIDRHDRPWLLFSDLDEEPAETYLARLDEDGIWRTRSLRSSLPEPHRHAWDLSVPGGLMFDRAGDLWMALTIAHPEDRAAATLWGHPTSEVIVLHGRPQDRTFRTLHLDREDPERARWLPNVVRASCFGPPERFGLLYTDGPKGAGLDDHLRNAVHHVEVRSSQG